MKILVMHFEYPMYDRGSGDLRLSQMLKLLAQRHELHFCHTRPQRQIETIGEQETARYRAALERMGIVVIEQPPLTALKIDKFDVLFFEFYFIAQPFMHAARRSQPRARIVVDSVDVVFHRLFAKARLSRDAADHQQAGVVKRDELAVYANADVVLTVTEADRQVLLTEVTGLHVAIVPNIHPIPPRRVPDRVIPETLIFVGAFRHEPNVDAMIYFCHEVLPLIRAQRPGVRLRIVGGWAPDSVSKLADDHVEVLGFVPDTMPLLESSQISIAPLRFGGGMKGKIGEAMAHGLPVVTTSSGIEGFGLSPGENVLVGDTPQSFAQGVIDLLRDSALYAKIGEGGWMFIRENYSEEAVATKVHALFDAIQSQPARRSSPVP